MAGRQGQNARKGVQEFQPVRAVEADPDTVGLAAPPATLRLNTPTACPYRVRTQRSGYGGFEKYIVVRRRGDGSYGRVTVHAHTTREGALAEADELNIGDLELPHADDPRPYEVRRAEAAEWYAEVLAAT